MNTRKIASYLFGSVGAIIALFSSSFYLLFTETIWINAFWAGIIIFGFALLGAISIFLIKKRPAMARRNLFIAGIGGCLGLLFLVGFVFAIFDGTFFGRPALMDFSGYLLLILAGFSIKKENTNTRVE